MALMDKDGGTHGYIAPQDRERVAAGAPVTSLPHRGHWVGPRQTARGTEYPVFDHTGANIVDWTLEAPPSLTETATTSAQEWAKTVNQSLSRPENIGHGHVFKRPDGVKARCGGPSMCSECAQDYFLAHGSHVPKDGFSHTPESNLPKLPKRDNYVDSLPKHALKVVQAVVEHYPTTLEERAALNKAYAALLMIDQRTSAK